MLAPIRGLALAVALEGALARLLARGARLHLHAVDAARGAPLELPDRHRPARVGEGEAGITLLSRGDLQRRLAQEALPRELGQAGRHGGGQHAQQPLVVVPAVAAAGLALALALALTLVHVVAAAVIAALLPAALLLLVLALEVVSEIGVAEDTHRHLLDARLDRPPILGLAGADEKPLADLGEDDCLGGLLALHDDRARGLNASIIIVRWA